ncbi:MAG: hypothetical protein WC865_14205 [Bacteroidales bacterium]
MRRAKVILLLFVMQLSFNLNAQQPANARSTTMNLWLPEQVPYLNPIRPKQIQYCIGNGILAALAEPSGQWNALIGPGYGAGKGWTEKEVVLSETLQLVVDGKPSPVRAEMKRARKTGIFYGTGVIGDIRYHLIDHARFDDSWLSRLVLLENTSASSRHHVIVQALLRNAEAPLKDALGNPCGYKNHKVIITFTDLATTSSPDGDTISIAAMLEPGGSHHRRTGAGPGRRGPGCHQDQPIRRRRIHGYADNVPGGLHSRLLDGPARALSDRPFP